MEIKFYDTINQFLGVTLELDFEVILLAKARMISTMPSCLDWSFIMRIPI